MDRRLALCGLSLFALLACSSNSSAPPPTTTPSEDAGELDTSIAPTEETGGDETGDDAGTPADGAKPDSGSSDTAITSDATSDALGETAPDTTASGPCEAGAIESEACGKCGKRERLCGAADGGWLPWGACAAEKGICTPAETRSVKCGKCGTRKETCSTMCAWDPGACTGEGVCNEGDTEVQFGACPIAKQVKTRTCGTTCAWSDWSACTLPKGWDDMAAAPISGRQLHTAIWTGTEMIVWGGQASGASYAADGAAYDPAKDTWATLPAAPILGRYGHTAIWTGSKMIVWGGYYGSLSPYYRADGASYDPSTKAWATLPAAPIAARQYHGAVWTGTEMIIWGGYGSCSGSYCVDGAAYNPSTNTWRTLKASTLPARQSPMMVWDGSKVVIFGGYGSCAGSYCADGAVYDPSGTETWTTISGVPLDGRRFGAAFATGTGNKLATFWGGYGSSYKNTGATYDAASASWKAMATPTDTLFPGSARYYFASWWTGSKMYVWGGTGSTTYANGASWDQATDTWTAMPDTGAPTARYYATAVWTGTEAIVWGGYSYKADGKIFRP